MTRDLQRVLREALADLSSCQRVLHEGIQLAVDRGLAQEAARFRSMHDEVVSLECDVYDELARRRTRPAAGLPRVDSRTSNLVPLG